MISPLALARAPMLAALLVLTNFQLDVEADCVTSYHCVEISRVRFSIYIKFTKKSLEWVNVEWRERNLLISN